MNIKRKIDGSNQSSENRRVFKKKRKLHTSPSVDKSPHDIKRSMMPVKDSSSVRSHHCDSVNPPNANSESRKELLKKKDSKKEMKKRKKWKNKFKEHQKFDSVIPKTQSDVRFLQEQFGEISPANSKHSEKNVVQEKPKSTGEVNKVTRPDWKERTAGQKRKKRFKNKKSNKRLKVETDAKPIPEQLAEKPVTVNVSCNWKALQQILKKTKKPTYHRRPKPGGDKPETERKSEIWFDDVDDILIETLKKKEENALSLTEFNKTETKSDNRLVKTGSFTGLTRVVAMDCEMVGVGEGGRDSVLARVSIVNHFGQCVYDKYVKSREEVTDYRTHVSGIRPEDINNASDFSDVQKEVSDILKDRILVGHAIENDLKVLFLDHPRRRIRDTSTYKPFRKLFSGRKPSLKKLSEKVLLVNVQEGEHNSVQDAQAAMRLYTMYRKQWEKDLDLKWHRKPQTKMKAKS